MAFPAAAGGGVLFGSLSAARRDRLPDHVAMTGSLLAISLPAFATGPLLVLAFSMWAGWLPAVDGVNGREAILPAIVFSRFPTVPMSRG
jgi:ABC-type dipeptide/oligopeptide/nickel transport system permease component